MRWTTESFMLEHQTLREEIIALASRRLSVDGPLPEGDLSELLDSVQRLTLVIAIMELAVHNNAVDEQMSAVVITAGILASLVYPSLSRRLLASSPPSEGDPALSAH